MKKTNGHSSKLKNSFKFLLLISLGFNSLSSIAQVTTIGASQNGDFSPCVLLLNDGLRDVYTTTNNVSFFSDSKQYFSSDDFVKDYHEGKWNGGISAVVDGVTLGLAGGATDNDLHQFQQKIRQASAVTISLSTYQTISKSTLNIDLANKFNECIEEDQTYGPSLSINQGDDNSVIITLNYKSLSSQDLKPTIKSVSLVGLNSADTRRILNAQLRIGSQLADHISFTAKRTPNQDLLISINTNNGLTTTKRLEAIDNSNNGVSPIGTIIASTIDFEHFSTLTKNNGLDGGNWSPTKSKWAPCDGRSLVGSKYWSTWAGAIGTNAPDLRGVFLRGLNQFDPNEGSAVSQAQKNPEDKKRNEEQSDAVGQHTHSIDMRTGYMMDLGRVPNPPIPTSVFVGDRFAYANSYGLLTATTNGTGMASETRPKNVSIFYYIRIN